MSFILDEKPKLSKPNNSLRLIVILIILGIFLAAGMSYFLIQTDSAVENIENEIR